MNPSEIAVILKLHRKWLNGEEGGVRADLRWANLWRADLRGANLRGAYLRGANLRGANLRDANLRGVDLVGANLWRADLREAYLMGADFEDACLVGADLTNAKLPEFQLPSGKLLGYKKVLGGAVLTLEISEERTACLISNKCRCRSVKVLRVDVKGTEFRSLRDENFIYRVGETVTVEDWSDDIRVECAPGIHFFKTYKEALGYWF